MVVKVSEAIQRITEDGWYFVKQRGSHKQYKHPHKPGRVTIPGRPNDELNPKTWRSILIQAGLKDE
ncbi:MAG: type II toxin-antitoxin system HicA family toxin [Spirochaetota bacterium]